MTDDQLPPAPPPTFDSLPLSQEVKRALVDLGYVTPTPVQLAVFGPASEGKDLVVQARTGTGKTTAFGLPLVDALLRRSVEAVQSLVLTPTRELALQVSEELRKLGVHRAVRVTAIYGGAPMQPQIDELARAPHIVVGTPGRVLDHLRRGTFDPSHLRTFVLDEADEMLSMGFARELSAIVEHLPTSRQGLFFSATIPPDIERMAREKLRDPEFVTLSSDQAGALSIDHFVYQVQGNKPQALLKVIEVENPESAIVFCNTKDETERVAEVLRHAGYEADWLNGDLEQKERERVMRKTREGRLRFLVCTDVAARGIDISHLTHVINHDFPESAENYVHRTGRTGRAGRTGTAISLIAPRDVGNVYLVRLTYKIRPIEKQLPTSTELQTRAEQDVVDSFLSEYGERKVDDGALAIAKRLLSHDRAPHVIAHFVRALLGETAPSGGAALEQRKARAAEARRAKPPRATAPLREPTFHEVATVDEDCAPTLRPSAQEPERKRGKRRSSFRDDDGPRFSFTVEDAPVAAPTTLAAPAAPAAAETAPVTRLYLNVGRRDGLTDEQLTTLLGEAGLTPASPPLVRDRMTYLDVLPELATRAIEALNGKHVGEREVVAEPARPQRDKRERAPRGDKSAARASAEQVRGEQDEP